MLHETLKKDMQETMKQGDPLRLQTLRGVLAACTNALIEQKKKPNEVLEDTSVIAVLKRLIKQRKESATQYRAVGSEERAVEEDKERAILEMYVPAGMSEEEIRVVVVQAQEELGVTEKKDKGLLMKTSMQKLEGGGDGALVGKIVDDLLH